MDWKKISIYTDDIERVSTALYMMDIYEFEIVDSFEEIKAELDKRAKYWDFIDEEKMRKQLGDERIVIYVQAEDDELYKRVKDGLKDVDCVKSIVSGEMKDEDWLNSWKRFFTPIKVGDNIMVAPCWQEDVPKDMTVIRIDPGMIFGTGSHETTRLCLEEIEKHIKKGSSFLDLGCGSGILSIGALLLGARQALCVDIEENAREVVKENAELNGINSGIETLVGDLLEDKELISRLLENQYEFIAANIVAGVIIGILPMVKRCLDDYGIFVCSGIIDDRVDGVRNALLENGFKIISEKNEDKWTAFTTVKER